MRAEIVSIGSELLLGQIVDTNAAFIARHLAGIGLDLFHKTTVGDNLGRAVEAIRTALGRAHVVITTGGLGPTAEAGTGGLIAERLSGVPGVAERVHAFVTANEAGARTLGLGDGSSAELAEAVRGWAKADLAAATVIGPAAGKGADLIYPTRIGVAVAGGGAARHDYRFGGDVSQVRVRACVMALDRLRRALAGGSA